MGGNVLVGGHPEDGGPQSSAGISVSSHEFPTSGWVSFTQSHFGAPRISPCSDNGASSVGGS